jgi:hypothetical protein
MAPADVWQSVAFGVPEGHPSVQPVLLDADPASWPPIPPQVLVAQGAPGQQHQQQHHLIVQLLAEVHGVWGEQVSNASQGWAVWCWGRAHEPDGRHIWMCPAQLLLQLFINTC